MTPLWNREAEWARRLTMIHEARSFLYLSTYYLEHDDERERIAENGYKEVLKHTYAHRIETILSKTLKKEVANAGI